jgi:hypothetical protein
MSYWTMMAVTGAVALLGALFAVLIFKLDADTLDELNTPEDERRWTSII